MQSELLNISRQLAGLSLKRRGLALGLWGEAGIGKTHAAQGLLQAATCRSHAVRATQRIEDVIPRIPTPRKASSWLETTLLGLARGERLGPEPLAQALIALLVANAPVILLVEDLHEAGAEELGAWTDLAHQIPAARGVGLLTTSRDRPPEGFESIRLSGLSRAESDAMLEAEAGAVLPQEALAWLFEHASGNPLYTLEFFRFLARQGFLWNDGRRWRWRVPEREVMPVTVEALIERALRDTAGTPQLERALAAKAVLGIGTSQSLWSSVAQLSEEALKEAQQELERKGVLVSDEFTHPLYREVIARSMPPIRRQALARLALEVLTDDPEGAAGFIGAAGLEAARALELLEDAARRARSANNGVQAARFLAQAVEYATGETRTRLAAEAASALKEHDLPETTRLARIALESPQATVETLRIFLHALARQKRVPGLEELIGLVPEHLRQEISPTALLVEMHNLAGDHQAALEFWETDHGLREEGSPELLRAVAASLLACGNPTRAGEIVERSLTTELSPKLRAEFLSIKALMLFHAGDYPQAETTMATVLDLLEEHGLPRARSTALVNRAAFARMRGDYDLMSDSLEEALRLRREAGDSKAYAYALAAFAEALTERGEYERAEEHIEEAVAILESHGPSRFLIGAHSQAFSLYTSLQTSLGSILALKHAQTALRLARDGKSPRMIREVLYDASVAHTQNGDAAHGLALAEEAFALAQTAGSSPYDELRSLTARGLALAALGQKSEALDSFRRAESLGGDGLALEIHKIGLEIDRLTRDLESAKKHLAWFEERGLLNGANIARRYFPELAAEGSFPALNPPELESTLRLEVLGSMQLRHGESLTPIRGGRRKELLALLLESRIAGRGEITSLDLCDALYPLEPEDSALGALKATIFKIRSSLHSRLVSTTPNGYALGTVASDAEAFLQTGDTRLWRGPYLEDALLEGRDENVREALHHGLRTRATAILDGGDPDEAVRLGRILLRAEPYDLDALRLACRALRVSGNHKGLSRLYAEAHARMLEVGEMLPERWVDFLEHQPAGA